MKHIIINFILLTFSLSAFATEFTVTNTSNSGTGSLRAAVTSANASGGPHQIKFNIPCWAKHSLRPYIFVAFATCIKKQNKNSRSY